jgi:hypothetical protein
MEHEDAIRLRSAERYVAGELSPEEQDSFEEHFFDCPECAEEVRWEQIFAANARAVSRERLAPAHRLGFRETWQSWFRPRPLLALSLAANAILVIGFGYFLATATRGGGGPRFVPSYFAPPPARALPEPKLIPAGASAFAVHFPAPDRKSPSYSYEIFSAAGTRESGGVLQASAGEDGDLYLEVPLNRLPAGVHALTIYDSSGAHIIAPFHFQTSR